MTYVIADPAFGYKKAESEEQLLCLRLDVAFGDQIAGHNHTMKLLFLLCTLGLVALAAAEPRLRLSGSEEDLVRRAKELLKRKGRLF